MENKKQKNFFARLPMSGSIPLLLPFTVSFHFIFIKLNLAIGAREPLVEHFNQIVTNCAGEIFWVVLCWSSKNSFLMIQFCRRSLNIARYEWWLISGWITIVIDLGWSFPQHENFAWFMSRVEVLVVRDCKCCDKVYGNLWMLKYSRQENRKKLYTRGGE